MARLQPSQSQRSISHRASLLVTPLTHTSTVVDLVSTPRRVRTTLSHICHRSSMGLWYHRPQAIGPTNRHPASQMPNWNPIDPPGQRLLVFASLCTAGQR
jgi:hypothetical protein